MVVHGSIFLQDSDTYVNPDSSNMYRDTCGLPPLPKGSLIFQKVMKDIRRDTITDKTESDNDPSKKKSEPSDSKKKRLFHRRVMVKGTYVYVFLSRTQTTSDGPNGSCSPKQTTTDSTKQRRWTTHLGSPDGKKWSDSELFRRRNRLSMENEVFLPSVTATCGVSDRKPRSLSEPFRSRIN